jgi:hypothetical protein
MKSYSQAQWVGRWFWLTEASRFLLAFRAVRTVVGKALEVFARSLGFAEPMNRHSARELAARFD